MKKIIIPLLVVAGLVIAVVAYMGTTSTPKIVDQQTPPPNFTGEIKG